MAKWIIFCADPDAEDSELRTKIEDNLRITFIREELGSTWNDGMSLGMHAKHFIVDDVATYVGSQNLYMCDLAEWGVVIDDVEQTKKFMDTYWNPMWKHSYTGEDVDVDAVMDGLEIERDGGDATDLDDEMKEQMRKAELANAGVSSGGLYHSEWRTAAFALNNFFTIIDSFLPDHSILPNNYYLYKRKLSELELIWLRPLLWDPTTQSKTR